MIVVIDPAGLLELHEALSGQLSSIPTLSALDTVPTAVARCVSGWVEDRVDVCGGGPNGE